MRSVILAGFMGTGKSTVGKLLAAKLARPYIDADAAIEQREGLSIPQIFAQHGEAYFRSRERVLAEEFARSEDQVIAVGGGMVVNPELRALLLANCMCIGLHATPDIIVKRIGSDGAALSRPMLQGGDLRARIVQLLAERAPAYRDMHYSVSTSDRFPDHVATQLASLAAAEQMRIPVAIPGRPTYDIVIGDGILEHLGALIAGRGWTSPVAIVSDTIVASHYAGAVLLSLRAAGIDAFVHTMHYGERHKSLASVEAMYRAFSQHGMDRRSPVIALGGGVVGDTAGFAAATYLRGVPFVQVPTSLLAMADSSIGGKTGVDTDFGKNLVGAFKQPDLVVMDTRCLGTLPAIELREGYAEIIKAAVLAGGEAYRDALSLASSPLRAADDVADTGADGFVDAVMMRTLVNAILLKRDVVQEDPHELGRRAILNLGHTFGHGIEAWAELTIKHGHCVALGMICALRLSEKLGLLNSGSVAEVHALLRGVGLPTAWRDASRYCGGRALDVDGIWRSMQSDKKKIAGQLRFVVARAPGDVFVKEDITEEDARWALATL